jgi:DNA processing protein
MPAGTEPEPSPTRPFDRDEEVDAALRFLLVRGVGVGRMRQLRASCGSFAWALGCAPAEVSAAIRVDELEAARILAEARACDAAVRAERDQSARLGARIVLLADPGYPELLRASPDPPELLFVQGDLPMAVEPAVAIVGSRRATAYGSLQAGALAVALAERGMTVVSGGARGIDAEAHRGALRAGGRTIAVLATGFAQPYPIEHAQLFETVVAGGGALVTEQPSFVTARPDLFPRRNRVIAALSLVTVVVEAANRSGALLTARIAVDDLSREAACMPGPVTSALSAGCHRAIREGWAHLVTGVDDVVEILAEARSLVAGASEAAERARRAASVVPTRRAPRVESVGKTPPPGCSADADLVSKAIRRLGGAGFDELERELHWTVPRIATAALELEILGVVARDAQGAFRMKRA